MDLFEKFSFKKVKVTPGKGTSQELLVGGNETSNNFQDSIQLEKNSSKIIAKQDSNILKTSASQKLVTFQFKDKKTIAMARSASKDITIEQEKIFVGGGTIKDSPIMIASWNIASIRRILNNGSLQEYVTRNNPDILFMCETKIDSELSTTEPINSWFPSEYQAYFNCCKIKKGYSGTGVITKLPPIQIFFGIGKAKYDNEGRTITLEYDNFYIVGAYVPNAGEGIKNLGYRTEEWDVDFREYLKSLKERKPVIVCGDLNVAHEEIDIYEPKGHEKSACFTPQERGNFTKLLDCGFVDTFRYLYPHQKKFSFFSYRFDSKQGNRGWRLDYFLVDERIIGNVVDSIIQGEIEGSDHHPVELVLKPNFNLK